MVGYDNYTFPLIATGGEPIGICLLVNKEKTVLIWMLVGSMRFISVIFIYSLVGGCIGVLDCLRNCYDSLCGIFFYKLLACDVKGCQCSKHSIQLLHE